MIGTFGFALSGAMAAKERELDIFGIVIIAFLTACGGGIVRDICLGVFPPIGISHWPYLALTLIAVFVIVVFHRHVARLSYPVLLFDAVGLSMFAVAGSQKAIFLGFNYEVAVIVGVLTAIGGGIIRETLLDRIPVVLRKEVYGVAALIATLIVVLFHYFELNSTAGAWLAIFVCLAVRFFSIKRKWNLPRV